MVFSGAINTARIDDKLRVFFDQIVVKGIMVGRQNPRILSRQKIRG